LEKLQEHSSRQRRDDEQGHDSGRGTTATPGTVALAGTSISRDSHPHPGAKRGKQHNYFAGKGQGHPWLHWRSLEASHHPQSINSRDTYATEGRHSTSGYLLANLPQTNEERTIGFAATRIFQALDGFTCCSCLPDTAGPPVGSTCCHVQPTAAVLFCRNKPAVVFFSQNKSASVTSQTNRPCVFLELLNEPAQHTHTRFTFEDTLKSERGT
jgi:hypothetical protein